MRIMKLPLGPAMRVGGLRAIGLLGAVLITGSCTSPTGGNEPPEALALPGVAMMRVGERVSLGDTPYDLALQAIVSDTRCPVDVYCPLPGSVVSRFHLINRVGDAPVDQELLLATAHTVMVEGLYFRLDGVSPPRRGGQTIRQADYILAVTVSTSPLPGS